MNVSRLFRLSMLISASLVSLVYANEVPLNHAQSRTVDAERLKTQTASVSIASQSRAWGLSVTEWQRYQTLLDSPQGMEMQHSNPISVLGRSARTAVERTKYAEMLVQYEKQSLDGLLAFNNARQDAWKRLYPNLPVIRTSTPKRVALFVESDCTTCANVITQWRSLGAIVDIYMVGSGKSDTVLRQWAMKAGIRKADVDEGSITLNHDTGNWLLLAQAKPVPVAIAQNQGGTWAITHLPEH